MDSGGLTGTATSEIVVFIRASIDFNPHALNMRSMGKWVTVYIELPDAYSVRDIRLDSVVLNGRFPVTGPSEILDSDSDGVQELMVKFDRGKLFRVTEVDTKELVTMTVSGSMLDGTPFEGSDDIMLLPGGGGLASHSLTLGGLSAGWTTAIALLAGAVFAASSISLTRRRRKARKGI